MRSLASSEPTPWPWKTSPGEAGFVELELLFAVVEAHGVGQAGWRARQVDGSKPFPVALPQPHPALAQCEHVEASVAAQQRQQRFDMEVLADHDQFARPER